MPHVSGEEGNEVRRFGTRFAHEGEERGRGRFVHPLCKSTNMASHHHTILPPLLSSSFHFSGDHTCRHK
jgi:hypothetical protein